MTLYEKIMLWLLVGEAAVYFVCFNRILTMYAENKRTLEAQYPRQKGSHLSLFFVMVAAILLWPIFLMGVFTNLGDN